MMALVEPMGINVYKRIVQDVNRIRDFPCKGAQFCGPTGYCASGSGCNDEWEDNDDADRFVNAVHRKVG